MARFAIAVACLLFPAFCGVRATAEGSEKQSPNQPTVRATNFQSTKVYQSKQRPSHTSWVSLFPSESDKWFLSCQEVTSTDLPQRRASKQHVYEMSLPRGYDSSKYLKELVLLKSDNKLQHWNVISRTPTQTDGGAFAQAATKDGELLRFVWACYSTDPSVKPSEIYYRSKDAGKTWKKCRRSSAIASPGIHIACANCETARWSWQLHARRSGAPTRTIRFALR